MILRIISYEVRQGCPIIPLVVPTNLHGAVRYAEHMNDYEAEGALYPFAHRPPYTNLPRSGYKVDDAFHSPPSIPSVGFRGFLGLCTMIGT